MNRELKFAGEDVEARAPKRVALPFDHDALLAQLRLALPQMQIALSESEQLAQIAFLRALHAQNQIHNLTSIRDPAQMLIKHVLDSLAVKPFIRTERLIDVGSGGGVPGLPLLLAGACQSLLMIDSVAKKMRSVASIAETLGVDARATTLHARVEDLSYRDPRLAGATQVIARAFSSLKDFVTLAGPLAAVGGELLAMKGVVPEQEIAEHAAGEIGHQHRHHHQRAHGRRTRPAAGVEQVAPAVDQHPDAQADALRIQHVDRESVAADRGDGQRDHGVEHHGDEGVARDGARVERRHGRSMHGRGGVHRPLRSRTRRSRSWATSRDCSPPPPSAIHTPTPCSSRPRPQPSAG